MDIIRLRELYINGAMAMIVLVTYCTLTIISMLNWNEAISAGLVMGFALLAKDVVSKMFQLMTARTESEATNIPVNVINQPPKQ